MLPSSLKVADNIISTEDIRGNARREMTTVLPRKRVRFLDEGEGKICCRLDDVIDCGESASALASEQDMGTGDVEERSEHGGDQIDKVREGSTHYRYMQSNHDSDTPSKERQAPRKKAPDANKVLPIPTVLDEAREGHLSLVGQRQPQMDSMLNCYGDESNGLRPPHLASSNTAVLGRDKRTLRKQNKCRRLRALETQPPSTQWTQFRGDFFIPDDLERIPDTEKQMAPSGLALRHPAGHLLAEWSAFGCPTMTGRPWTKEEMTAAVERGPHKSALTEEAILHFETEVAQKVAAGQAKVLLWLDIRDNPPEQLKISPIAAVPHTSKPFRSILDLSFALKLSSGAVLPSVNETTTKTAPQASVDQLGHALSRMIHAFAEATPDDKIFMAKWDVKDGFWRLECQEGEEYNFAYVLPQRDGEPVKLVVPTSLQMGWIESPAYFCTASETSRDIAHSYCQAALSSIPPHKFKHYMQGSDEFNALPISTPDDDKFSYMIEVFVDDFMSLAIATSQRQLEHVGTGTMMGIHDVFPASETRGEDPISEKKMDKLDSQFDTRKTLLGFDFDGADKTMWLQEEKRAALLLVLKSWLRSSIQAHAGIPFKTFESVTAKLRHAFTAIPAGVGLLSPCNKILALKPSRVYLHRNKELRTAISDIRSLLRMSVLAPTKCVELVSGWPDYIGYTDASGEGFGGIIIGDGDHVIPTVFRGEWPPDIKASLVSLQNPNGALSINDLEMAGFLITWLIMETTCADVRQKNVALFSDNSPSISWVERLASRRSLVGSRLVRALALRMKICGVCPLTPLHVAGIQNSMADVASRSFGKVKQWHCTSDSHFAAMFNVMFPLPLQNTWTVFRPTPDICMKVISILRMKVSSLEEWRRIPRTGQHTGTIGAPMSNLWEWTRTYNIHHTPSDAECSQDLPRELERDIMAEDDKSKLKQYLQLSRPLARRSLWNVRETH